jgi:ArsR family transcriptional regulator, cadmium/lead-responsive transcriptional repressor
MMVHIKEAPGAALLSRQASVFKALSSPARLAIVKHLARGPASVGELVGMLSRLDCPCSRERTNISKHLAVLRGCGIVSAVGEEQRRIYRLDTPCLVKAIDCVTERSCLPVTRPDERRRPS